MAEYKAFTFTGTNILNRLCTDVYVFSKYSNQDLSKTQKWRAVWDTGATSTCISSNIVSRLNLIPIGKKLNSTAGGIVECNTYCIDIILPNNVSANGFVVHEVSLTDCDMLIGMDIIKYGDFSISNFEGRTQFSFRIPSVNHADYVKEYKMQKINTKDTK